MKKKLLAMLLASVMVLSTLSLVACGNGGGNGGDDAGGNGATATEDADTGDVDTDDGDAGNGDADPGGLSGDVRILWVTCAQATETMALLDTYFAAMHPNVNLIHEEAGAAEIHQMYLIEFATGNSQFDIINSRHIFKNQLVESGWVVDITDRLNNSELISPDSFSHNFSDFLVQVDGQWWGLPWRSDVKIFYYNPEIFEQAGIDGPPTTYAQLLEVAERIYEETGYFGLVVPGDGRWVFQAYNDIISTLGGYVYLDSNYEPIFNSPAHVEALEILIRMFELSPPGAVTYDHSGATTSFIQGESAMVLMWPFLYSNAQNPEQSRIVGNVGLASHAPIINEVTPVFSGWNLMMTSFSENQDAAWAVMEWIVSAETEKQVIMNGGDTCPVNLASALDEELYEHFPIVRTILEAMDAPNFFADYDIAEWADASVIIQDHLQRAVIGDITAQEALDLAVEDVRALFVSTGRLD